MAVTWTKKYKTKISGKQVSLLVTKWINPYYKKNGVDHTILNRINPRAKSGVYFIRSKRTKKIVYIGYSRGKLYFTMYRHFQEWTLRGQQAKTFSRNRYMIRIIFCTPAQADKLEQFYIARYKPEHNAIQYSMQYADKIKEDPIEIAPF